MLSDSFLLWVSWKTVRGQPLTRLFRVLISFKYKKIYIKKNSLNIESLLYINILKINKMNNELWNNNKIE
jgi:hypothetical protein